MAARAWTPAPVRSAPVSPSSWKAGSCSEEGGPEPPAAAARPWRMG